MKRTYKILVPTVKPAKWPGRKRFFKTKYHRQWDAKVIAISGGITIAYPTKGSWIFQGKTFTERMIPVEIRCTEEQMEKIRDITAAHYGQIEVYVDVVSIESLSKQYPENIKYHEV